MTTIVVGSAGGFGSAQADADNDHGSAVRNQGAGSSWQHVYWDRPDRDVRLVVDADTSLSTDRCIDAVVDWVPDDGTHYDARVVRNCRPGGRAETDPDGNGYWTEPSNWDEDTHDSPVVGPRTAAAYTIDDDTLVIQTQAVVFGTSNIYGGDRNPPATENAGWADVRTLYQSGAVGSSRGDNAPERCWQNDDMWGNDCAGWG